MKINANEVPKDGLVLEETQSAKTLDIESNGIGFNAPVHIRVEIQRQQNRLQISINIESRMRLACGRCLKDFEQDLSKDIKVIRPLGETPIIDITQIVREEIVLDYPFKLLCRPDCKGLCIICGKDLNTGACNCKDKNKPLGATLIQP